MDLETTRNKNSYQKIIQDFETGKTNILDAVYYLSFCKSFSTPVDLLNINHEESFFMLNGNYLRQESTENISVGFKKCLVTPKQDLPADMR